MCPTPPNAVDVTADGVGFEKEFRSGGSEHMMDPRLRQFMSEREYADLFADVNASIRRDTGCKLWHLPLWIHMIALWPLGGFMYACWGVGRATYIYTNCVGRVVMPFCEQKSRLNWFFIPPSLHEHGGTPAVIRFMLPHSSVPSDVVVGRPLGHASACDDGGIGKENPIEMIGRLKQLYDSGALTQAEFESKKAELLAKV